MSISPSRIPPPRPAISFEPKCAARCSRCGAEWRAAARTQLSPCCHRPRLGDGAQPQGLPARNPFHDPMPGDRLSTNAGLRYRVVTRRMGDMVAYTIDQSGVECHCSLAAWRAWADGSGGRGVRNPAKVERRGDV